MPRDTKGNPSDPLIVNSYPIPARNRARETAKYIQQDELLVPRASAEAPDRNLHRQAADEVFHLRE